MQMLQWDEAYVLGIVTSQKHKVTAAAAAYSSLFGTDLFNIWLLVLLPRLTVESWPDNYFLFNLVFAPNKY